MCLGRALSVGFVLLTTLLLLAVGCLFVWRARAGRVGFQAVLEDMRSRMQELGAQSLAAATVSDIATVGHVCVCVAGWLAGWLAGYPTPYCLGLPNPDVLLHTCTCAFPSLH